VFNSVVSAIHYFAKSTKMSNALRSKSSSAPTVDRSVLCKRDKIFFSLYILTQEFSSFLNHYEKNPEIPLSLDVVEQQIQDIRSCCKTTLDKFPRWSSGQSRLRDVAKLHLQLIALQRRLFDGKGDMEVHDSIDVRWEHCREDLTEILDEILALFRKS